MVVTLLPCHVWSCLVTGSTLVGSSLFYASALCLFTFHVLIYLFSLSFFRLNFLYIIESNYKVG